MAEVEIVVNKVEGENGSGSMQEASRKMMLAWLGAMSMVQDAVIDYAGKCVDRGVEIEQGARKQVRDRMEQRKQQVHKVIRRQQAEVEAVESTLQDEIEGVLAAMDVPTKSDIETLTAKIAELGKKVDELKDA